MCIYERTYTHTHTHSRTHKTHTQAYKHTYIYQIFETLNQSNILKLQYNNMTFYIIIW